jgi:NitT/TauT family transport system permease protein
VIWFGLGETSKIVLIIYTTVFMVAINTMIGVLGVEPDKRFAALCLAPMNARFSFTCYSRRRSQHRHRHEDRDGKQLHDCRFRRDGRRQVGVGFLIFNSRLFLLTEWIFVGIITLGVMGFVTDRALRILAATLLAI